MLFQACSNNQECCSGLTTTKDMRTKLDIYVFIIKQTTLKSVYDSSTIKTMKTKKPHWRNSSEI